MTDRPTEAERLRLTEDLPRYTRDLLEAMYGSLDSTYPDDVLVDVRALLAALEGEQSGMSGTEMLTEIAEGRGPYKRDSHEHAVAVIEHSKKLASTLLRSIGEAP